MAMPAAKNTGPLDWRIAIVDKTGRPTPEFQRRWATQQTNNGLIGFIGTGTGAPTGTPSGDGELYVDTSIDPWVLYGAEDGIWHVIGVVNFTDLADVPATYIGSGGYVVRVKSTEDGLEFISFNDILDTIGADWGDILFRGSTGWEVLSAGTDGYVLSTHGPGADPEWVPQAIAPATPHQYWRFLTTANGPGGLSVLAEAGFCTTVGGPTVTTGGTAIADSAFGSFTAAHAFDGNPSTDWATSSGGAGVAYIGYDFGLGNEQNIVDTYIQASATFQTQCPVAVAIQWSDDNIVWNTIATGAHTGWTAGQIVFFTI